MRSTRDILGSRVPVSPTQMPTEGSRRRSVMICGIACIGMFSIGYEQGVMVIATASKSFLQDFCVGYKGMTDDDCSFEEDANSSNSDMPQSWTDFTYWMANVVIIGYIVGAFVGALLADFVGRRWTIVTGMVLFSTTTLWVTLSPEGERDVILVGRTFQGIAGGMYLIALPIYCVEIVAREFRGALAGFAQVLITGGYLAGRQLMAKRETDTDWQIVYFKSIIPAVILAIGGIYLPESPRWLHMHMGKELAEITLKRVRDTWLVQHEMDAIATQTLAVSDSLGWHTLINISIIKRIFMVIALQVFVLVSTLTASGLFASVVAIRKPQDFYDSIFGGVFPLYFVLQTISAGLAVGLMDYFGRRRLLLIGGIGMSLGHAITGISVISDCEGELLARTCDTSGSAVGILLGTFVVMLSLMICWTPTVWLYPAEIFPINVRAKATGIASALSGTCVFWVRELFPKLAELSLVSFQICLAALLLVFLLCHETNRKLLEDTEELFPHGFPSKQQRNSLSTAITRNTTTTTTTRAWKTTRTSTTTQQTEAVVNSSPMQAV
uniref:Hexose transporter 1 n=1 Tax=Globisporangium ultimum (strain ATCC 200006 / CBS 805.95 / DAOM BR144) TaxID=431595 RepID=K3WIT7_GLOUD